MDKYPRQGTREKKENGEEKIRDKIKNITFLDSNNDIIPELLDRDAQSIATEFYKKISTHQVRRFYDEVKRYQADIEKGKPYKDVKPFILMLKSKAKYAASKLSEMKIFYEFIEGSINKIKDADEEIERKRFSAFCLFFEAVYGFADLKK